MGVLMFLASSSRKEMSRQLKKVSRKLYSEQRHSIDQRETALSRMTAGPMSESIQGPHALPELSCVGSKGKRAWLVSTAYSLNESLF